MIQMQPDELYRYNYSVKAINSLRQYWRTQKSFSCINVPKQHNIFVFLDGCSATYTDVNGAITRAEAGSLIYAPEGSQYTASFDDFENDSSGTVGINFRLFDENMTPIIFSNDIKVYKFSMLRDLVEKIDHADKGNLPCYAAMKAGIYDIISILGSTGNALKPEYKIIRKGIDYLESGRFELSTEELAQMCNVSSAYFRRLFRQYSGMSPRDYRMHTKIRKAKEYLSNTDLTSCEIADLLDFTDASYFCHYFKSVTGMTPAEFKRANE